MAYRWHPKYSETDPDSPRAWGTCDRCGFVWPLYKLQWQFDYQGASVLQNLRILVCDPCYDVPQPQTSPYILPPDPLPVYNARPESYTLDETSWLSTQDGDPLATQNDDPIITPIPNPSNTADTASIQGSLDAGGLSLAALYLDLFNGNPATTGRSVLAAITGSATRTNIITDLTLVPASRGSDIYNMLNTDVITVSTGSASVTNLNYIGFYDSAIAGTLLFSGPVAVASHGGGINVGTTVQFNALELIIADVASGSDMISELGFLMLTEVGAVMVTQ